MVHLFRHFVLPAAIVTAIGLHAQTPPSIEVTGTSTVNIVPNRITIEIAFEEYYMPTAAGDSVLVKLDTIEKGIQKTLSAAGIAYSDITVADIGNYRNTATSKNFLMAKRISATVTRFDQIEQISRDIDRKGITSFNITKIDNTDIDEYNRQGLKAALDAARDKAQFIAETENVTLQWPVEIIENGPNYYETPTFSNVSYDSGAGMENMRRIVRRYSVKVRYTYSFTTN